MVSASASTSPGKQPRPTPLNRNGQHNRDRTRTGQIEPTLECTHRVHADQRWWSRLGSNQRPSACEADALPLSHGTGAERRTRSKVSTRRQVRRTRGKRCARKARRRVPKNLCGPLRWTIVVLRTGRRSRPLRADVAQLVAHHLAKVRVAGSNPVIRSRCKWHQSQRWSGRVVRQRPAKPCTRVRFPSPPQTLLKLFVTYRSPTWRRSTRWSA